MTGMPLAAISDGIHTVKEARCVLVVARQFLNRNFIRNEICTRLFFP
jgi:hypothetical protein